MLEYTKRYCETSDGLFWQIARSQYPYNHNEAQHKTWLLVQKVLELGY